MSTRAPRSYRIHWPSPCADQRVARLLSSVFCGRLPSFPLATTEAGVSGVRSAAKMDGLGELYGGLGSVRSLWHASARTTLTASVAFNRASRLDSLNLKFILGRSFKGRRVSWAGGPNSYRVFKTSGPLVWSDIDGRARGPGDAVPVEQRHAAGDAGGTAERACVDRHRATPEMVVPGHVPGVVHEERVELGGRQRDGAGLGAAAAQVQIRGVVVDDVVVVDVVRAGGRVFVNPPAVVDRNVVVHGRVIVRRNGAIRGDLNAVFAVGDDVIGDDRACGAVVVGNASGGRPGDDVVDDDATGAGRIDAVNEVRAGAHGDVVDHVADNLNANEVVAAAVREDAGIAAGAGQVVDAVADHLVVIAVDADAIGAVAGDIEVDDLDIVAAVPNGVAPRAIHLRSPLRVRDVGDGCGGGPALGHLIAGVAPRIIAGGEVGIVARAHQLGDARHGVAGSGGGAGIRVRARRRPIVIGAITQGVERRRAGHWIPGHWIHRHGGAAALPVARRRDRHRPRGDAGHEPARRDG